MSTFTRDKAGITFNQRQRWTVDADAELRRRVDERQCLSLLAKEMDRTQDAIRGRTYELGINLRSALRPWRDVIKRGQRLKRLGIATGDNS